MIIVIIIIIVYFLVVMGSCNSSKNTDMASAHGT